MNKQFIIKVMQAKQLQLEALKEVMPEKMLDRVSSLEKEMKDIGKEYIMTMMYQSDQKCSNTKNQDGQKSEAAHHDKKHKITIE